MREREEGGRVEGREGEKYGGRDFGLEGGGKISREGGLVGWRNGEGGESEGRRVGG